MRNNYAEAQQILTLILMPTIYITQKEKTYFRLYQKKVIISGEKVMKILFVKSRL